MNKYREPDIIFKWTNCCRLCLSQESTIDLFSEASISQHFPSKIRTCLNFLIYSGDPMPRKICATCCMKLDNWFQFRKECIQTEKDLRKRLQPYKKIAFVKEYFHKYMKYENSYQDGSISLDSMSDYDEDGSRTGDGDEDEDEEDEDMQLYSDSFQKEEIENSGLSDNDRNISKLEHQNFQNKKNIVKNSTKLSKNEALKDVMSNARSSLKDKELNSETGKITINLQKANLKNKFLDRDKYGNEITRKICSKRDVKDSIAKVTFINESTESKPNNSYSQIKSNLTNMKTSVNSQNRKISEEKIFKSCTECGMDFPNEEVFALHSCNTVGSGAESDDNDNFINPLSFVDTSLSEPTKEASEGDGNAVEIESAVAFKEDENTRKGVSVTPWKCFICSDYFESVLDLKQHYQCIDTNCIKANNNLYCEMCKKKFSSRDEFVTHQLAHIDNEKEDKSILVKCNSSNDEFSVEEQLKQHACTKLAEKVRASEMGEKFPCSKCDQTFPDKELYEKHELVHNQQDLYNLIVTPQFTTFEGIEEIENLTDEINHFDDCKKPVNVVRCFRCGRIFGSGEELEHHEMLKHKNPTPYFCRKCDLRFSARSQLLMHVRSHLRKNTASGPNQSGNISDNTCAICNAKFFLKSDLQSHLKMHKLMTSDDSQPPQPTSPIPVPQKTLYSPEPNGDNKIDLFARFKCSVCSKIFVHSGSIIRHGKNLHKGQTVYPLRLKRPIFLMKRARSLSLPNEKNLKSPQLSKPLTSSNVVMINSQQSQQIQVQEENFDMEVSQELRWEQDQEGLKSDGNLDFGTEKCPFCEKVFKPTYLPRHIKRNHRGEVLDPQMLGKEIPDDSLVCRYCLKSCSNPHNRRVHESIHYPVKMQCTQCKICGQKYFNKASYEVHILSCKSVRCGKCNKIFFRYLSLKNHSCVVTLPAENKA